MCRAPIVDDIDCPHVLVQVAVIVCAREGAHYSDASLVNLIAGKFWLRPLHVPRKPKLPFCYPSRDDSRDLVATYILGLGMASVTLPLARAPIA